MDMIIANVEDGPLVVGLTDLTIQQMKDGQIMRIDLAQFGGVGVLCIMHGTSPQDIVERIEADVEASRAAAAAPPEQKH